MANFLGQEWLYTATNWTAQVFYLEAYMRSTNGTTATMELFGDIQGSVPGSTISTTSTSFVRLRSSAMTLQDANKYRARVTSTGNTRVYGVKIIALN